MMAAAHEIDSPLDLFKLVLSLVQQHTDVPLELQRHFLAVVEQAKSLAKDPEHPHAGVSPEAVQLAYQVRLKKELGEVLDSITDFRSIHPDIAQRLLDKMEQRSVG
jgi:hypothetical protein